MKHLTQEIIDQIIKNKAFINNYPKPGVVFLTMDALFNNAASRKMVSDAVISAINTQSFDSVASIASRGYILSGIIANGFADIGEHFIQKVKTRGDSNYIQLDTKTEYSSDALQVLKNSIQTGKKYLLTDDLIATGGSVMTAVQLIRECGGQVDTVFVMTELLDFGAREKLKNEGIELISLLEFTNEDLQKLLLIQNCYHENPSTPITYRLSRHSKGEQQLISSTNTSALTVHVASESPLKIEAAQLAFKGMFDPLNIEVIGHKSRSHVNNQPCGYDETLSGAANRIGSIADNAMNLDSSILVSMENGIRYSEVEKIYYDFVHVIVKLGDMTFSHTQDCCEVPTEIINAIAKDKDNVFQETWGDAAKRLGKANQANNPHQEPTFGGISRSDYLFHALCKTLGKLKEKMMEKNNPKIEDQHFNISRLVKINSNKSKDKYRKKGVFFATPTKQRADKPVDLYNHGCPVQTWNIDPEKVKRTDFKIFSTGDAFSVLSPDVEINNTNINIHVGTEHASHSPLVLLHEALQLCRCVYEHGAGEITIALPEKFHPALHHNDFNLLLMSLFKASGANKIYFYNKDYKGRLDETNMNDIMPLTLSQQSDSEHYQISRDDLLDYLHSPNDRQPTSENTSLDNKVMHFTRKSHLQKAWSRFDLDHTNMIDHLSGKGAPSGIKIPEIKAQPHVLLSCSANKPLAEKIAANLRAHGEEVKVFQVNGKGEHATIPDAAEICGALVTIVQSTRPNPDNIKDAEEYQINGASSYLFEAAMIARQAELRGADKINLINPYQFSARSDKAENNPKGKTGAYVQHDGHLLKAAGVNQVVAAECHDAHTMSGSYTGKNIKGTALSALTIMSTKIASDWLEDPNHPMQGQLRLVTPDAGATKRTKELTQQLQAILGKKLCESRILGEKERDSHQDDSALINSLNTGVIGINADDKYLITDDETATGNTLCQAITNLRKNGAKDIAVIVVHNNMPLDWLLRQLCLARFLYLGVNDLHFSDTQEMGTLATNYQHLIQTCSERSMLPGLEVEKKVFAWFKKNISEDFKDKSEEYLNQEFARFQSIFGQFQSKIKVHSLASEFAHQVRTNHYVDMPAEHNGHDLPGSLPAATQGHYAALNGSLLFSQPQSGRMQSSNDNLRYGN